MHLHLHAWDVVVIIVSLLLVAGAGWWGARRAVRSETDYVLAGRTLTLPLFICTLIATWYGAILGVGEFVQRYGVATILCFGVPYYIAAIIYALTLSGTIRRSRSISIPEQFKGVYGGKASSIASVVMLTITVPAAYMLMIASFVQSISGWDFLPSLAVSAIVSMAYVYKGGLRSDVYANVVQTVLMYAGFIVLLVFAMGMFGSVDTMLAVIPHSHRTIPGNASWMFILGWWVVALQTFIDPNFHLRSAAAATPSIARKGMLLSVAGWMIFDLLTISTGLYAVAYTPVGSAVDTYIALSETVLPIAWKGLFAAGVIAAVMSTLDGYALVSATIIGRSIIDPMRRTPSVHSIRHGLLVSTVLSCLAAWLVPSVVDLLFNTASLALPSLLLPMILSYTRHAPRVRTAIVPLMLVPLGVSVSIMVLMHMLSVASQWDASLPLWGGLGVSATAVALLFFTNRNA